MHSSSLTVKSIFHSSSIDAATPGGRFTAQNYDNLPLRDCASPPHRRSNAAVTLFRHCLSPSVGLSRCPLVCGVEMPAILPTQLLLLLHLPAAKRAAENRWKTQLSQAGGRDVPQLTNWSTAMRRTINGTECVSRCVRDSAASCDVPRAFLVVYLCL